MSIEIKFLTFDITDEQFEHEMNIDLFETFKIARAAAIKSMIPEKRYGNEDELDINAIFLAAPSSSYVTGIMVPVDGGYTCM